MNERVATASVTLLDVARAAGVSLATASRALNGSTRRVRPDLRDRVLEAADALQYSANAQAQAMARGHTNLVGLVISDVGDPYFSSIAAGAIRAAEDHQLVVTMACTFGREEREIDYVAALRSQRARAVIVVGSRVHDRGLTDRLGAEVRSFEQSGGRVAFISQRKIAADTIVLENRAGARALAEALCCRGYRRFAILAGRADLLTARDRSAGFREGAARHGVQIAQDDVVHGGFNRDGGYDAMIEVLDRGRDVDCVFAVNDVMALGAMAALRDRGVALPSGMAVAGFDDIVTLRDVTPALTTVRLPLEDLGAWALQLVLEPSTDQPRIRRVRGEVVLRESTPVRP
ncbi:MAG TPA: LacI family DNA-binding transcriptional regulator [Pseudonocardia sp.]|jgi:LacI family transcriptional regulator|nr:LacI family DNA-binding transcriptional regulator [Pseudonocardia sp.]